MQCLSRVQRIFQQAGASHRANTARYRGDPAGAGQGGLVNHVADQLAIRLTVDANVDHDGAFLDPFALDQARLAGSYHHQVGAANVAGQILGETVSYRHGAASQQQLHRHRAANEGLEQRVEERTREFRQASHALQVEIDERKQLESQLIGAEKLASLGQMAAGIAHEINNPIGFISSNLGTLAVYFGGWRLTLRFNVIDNKKPVEMRAYLIKEDKPLSEIWSYQLPANE